MKVPGKVISDDSLSELSKELSELSKELKECRGFLCGYLEYGEEPLASRLSVPMVTYDKLRLLLVEAGYVDLVVGYNGILGDFAFPKYSDSIRFRAAFFESCANKKMPEPAYFGEFDHGYPDNLHLVIVDAGNRYGMPVGNYSINHLRDLVTKWEPAYDDELLQTRGVIIKGIREAVRLNDATNICDRVFFFNSHRWRLNGGVMQFFINPRRQKAYRYGWYTIEELGEWLERDSGPVVIGSVKGTGAVAE